MKLTKNQLKRLIKEELEAVLGQEQGMESSALPRGPQVDIEALVKSIQACIAQGGLMVGIKCGPIALELLTAIADENWLAALGATQALMACVPGACRNTLQELLAALQPLIPR